MEDRREGTNELAREGGREGGREAAKALSGRIVKRCGNHDEENSGGSDGVANGRGMQKSGGRVCKKNRQH